MTELPRTGTIAIEAVGRTFPAPRGGRAAVALESVSLDVPAGQFLCVVGPSGCGKTTLLNLIAGLDTPSTGAIRLDGVPIAGPGVERGVMFQDYALFPWRTVAGNVEFALRYGSAGARLSAEARARRVREVVALVGLEGSEAKYPHQLSGGMRQRVALGRLLAYEPRVLLMDEPLAALDAQTRMVLQDELLRIWGQDRPPAERRTVVFITHAIDEAVFLADRILVLSSHPGRIRDIVDVDLPRPRGDATRADPRFAALSNRIWEEIRGEAYRAART